MTKIAKPPVPETPAMPTPDTVSSPVPATSPARSKLVIPLGRGARGKTWWLRWAIERAQTAGRSVVVADADRTNATLSAYFSGVVSPPSAEDEDMRQWFIAFCQAMIGSPLTATLDLGGGDLLLKRLAREIDMVGFLESHAIQPVAVYLLGPDRDDLAYLQDLEADRLFAPKATILVLNEALVPKGRSAQAAFRLVIDNPIFEAALARGAKTVIMPSLRPAHEIDDRRLTFAAAEANKVKQGQAPIELWETQVIAKWRRDMEHAFGTVAAWLP